MMDRPLLCLLACFSLVGCSYNPLSPHNHQTGSTTGRLVGIGAGAGTATLLGAPTPIKILAGVTGGSIGYYATTLRYAAGGIYYAGGQVYQLGESVGIEVPTDKLFQANTAEFLPQATPILDSIVAVLERTPENNIIISGNTSGFSGPRYEQKLSQDRAKAVAAYLWNAGISQFKPNSNETRKLNYVGYGNFFPIASNYHNTGIRQNSRIQITSYPSKEDLQLDKHAITAENIGALRYKDSGPPPGERCQDPNPLPNCGN